MRSLLPHLPVYWSTYLNNFGDKLAPLIVKGLTGRETVFAPRSNQGKLITVGSILLLAQDGDVIWGSGIWQDVPFSKTPDLHVFAVRGPLSRQKLLDAGVSCPEVYGDPILLLPKVYTPRYAPPRDVIVIPHRADEGLRQESLEKEFPVLSTRLNPFQIIDAIAASKIVVTSSLHAMIVAEVYGIPVAFVRNQKHCRDRPHIKYLDYFTSTGRGDETHYDMPIETASREPISRPVFPNLARLEEALFSAVEFMDGRTNKKTLKVFDNSVTRSTAMELCTGCGVCTAVCPASCLEMTRSSDGFFRPEKNSRRCGVCGKCLDVCGGIGLEGDPEDVSVQTLTKEPLAAFLAKASDPVVRQNGQSGGAVTALLKALLQSRSIEEAIVTSMPKDGTLIPEASVIRSDKELPLSQGSKYLQVSLGAALRAAEQLNGKKAVVGLPCHFHSMENARKYVKPEYGGYLKIGLMCNRTLSSRMIDEVIFHLNIRRSLVATYLFRDKDCMDSDSVVLHSGEKIPVPDPLRDRCMDACTSMRCHLCIDKLNVTADIVAGDPWGISVPDGKHSVLLARTEAGLKAVWTAVLSGDLQFSLLNWTVIMKGQGIDRRRLRWMHACAVQNADDRPVPTMPFSDAVLATEGDGIFGSDPTATKHRESYWSRLRKCRNEVNDYVEEF